MMGELAACQCTHPASPRRAARGDSGTSRGGLPPSCTCASPLIRRFGAEQRKICISESRFDLPETSPLLTSLFSTKYSILITYHPGTTAPGLPGPRKWPQTMAESERCGPQGERLLGPPTGQSPKARFRWEAGGVPGRPKGSSAVTAPPPASVTPLADKEDQDHQTQWGPFGQFPEPISVPARTPGSEWLSPPQPQGEGGSSSRLWSHLAGQPEGCGCQDLLGRRTSNSD